MFKFLFPFILYFLAIILSVSTCYAGTPMVININEGIEEVPFETGDVDKDVTSSFVQTIEAADIRKTQTDLSQIIEKYSGISVRKTGGLGSFSLVSIRGKSANQVKIYVDGMLLNDASSSGVDLSLIPLNEIAAIEVYKDIVPIEFAEVSNGGVINIKTLRNSSTDNITITHMVGSFNTIKTDIHNQLNKKKWQYILTAGLLKSKNNFPYVNQNGTFENESDDRDEKRQNNQLDQYNFVAKAKYNISSGRKLTYQTEAFNKTKGLPPINNNAVSDTQYKNTNKNFTLKYLHEKFLIKNLDLNLNSSLNNKTTIYDDRRNGLGLTPDHLKYSTTKFESQLYLKLKKDNFELTGNSEIRIEELKYTDLLGKDAPQKNIRKTFVAGLQTNAFYFDRKFILSPTLRYQLTHDKISGLSITQNGIASEGDSNYQTISPQFGMRYSPTHETSFKFNIASYFRVPSYTELFGGNASIGANKELKPENGINSDIGMEFKYFPHSNIYTKINWQTAAFYSQIKNEIIYSFNSRGEGRPENTGHSIIFGFENQLLLELFYNLEISSNSTFLSPYNYTDSNRKRVLPGRPQISLSSKIAYRYHSIHIYVENLQEKFMFYDDEELLPATDKNEYNIGCSVTEKNLSFSFTINNLFDSRYKAYFFQTSPGRAIQFSTSFKFY